MMRRLIAALFGSCIAYGHRWVNIPPTPEESAEDQEAYQAWYDEYPIGTYPIPHGRTECAVCGKLKTTSSGGGGRPSGYHPGWG